MTTHTIRINEGTLKRLEKINKATSVKFYGKDKDGDFIAPDFEGEEAETILSLLHLGIQTAKSMAIYPTNSQPLPR